MNLIKLVIIGTSLALEKCEKKQRNYQCEHQDRAALDTIPIVEDLIKEMNLDEKLGQLVQISVKTLMADKQGFSLDLKMIDYYVNQKQVGSFMSSLAGYGQTVPGTPEQILNVTKQIQTAFKKNRLKIPMIYGIDSIHGGNFIYGATIFPHQLALASTFNRDIVFKVAEITARDTRSVGIHLNFSPTLDIAVNKQWSRVYETFGEDPYLVSELGKVTINGYQGCDLKRSDKVAAALKHFIGYSATKSGRDGDGTWMSERIINDYFRPPFQAAIDAGAAAVIESYSDIEGDHLVNSKRYLVDLLRTKMGFKGMLLTDWGQIYNLFDPIHIATSPEDAVRRCMELGTIDMSMSFNDIDLIEHIKNLLKKNLLSLNNINNNVRRILTLKYKLGLLDLDKHLNEQSNQHPAGFKSIGQDNVSSLEAAREAVILLENKNSTLPLKRNLNLLVIGPTADSLIYLTGGWTFNWETKMNDSLFQGNGTTILEGLQFYSSNVDYYNNIDIDGNKLNDHVFHNISLYDAVIVCLGESHYTESNGNINNMELPTGQIKLYESILDSTDKPVILVLTQGRPRVIGQRTSELSAIITSFLAGPYSGQAIADIIFGQVNPSGKLPITYSNHNNDNNLNYYHRFNENWNPGPMWEFGHGLSYTNFNYSNIILSKNKMSAFDKLTASVKLTNTGSRSGKEVCQMYITDLYRSVSPEVKKLRGFKKVLLKPNQSKLIKFTIDARDLMYIHLNNRYVIERGTFKVIIGTKSTTFDLIMDQNFFDMGI